MAVRVDKHEPGTGFCTPGWHCHIHHVDEWVARSYIACFECGHLYPTARSLRRVYHAEHWRIFKREWKSPLLPPNVPGFFEWTWREHHPRVAAVMMFLGALFIRARKIHFCQFCLHDW